jgi:hypothetical protein
MTSPQSPPQRLVDLLDTLAPEDRREITVWLLTQNAGGEREHAWLSGAGLRRQGVPTLGAAGDDLQLVTIRLPTESHAKLRTWCSEHGFTMAAVVRGLIERFLEDQQTQLKEA